MTTTETDMVETQTTPGQAAWEIAMFLDRRRWRDGDLETVATILRQAGFVIDPPEPAPRYWIDYHFALPGHWIIRDRVNKGQNVALVQLYRYLPLHYTSIAVAANNANILNAEAAEHAERLARLDALGGPLF